MADGHGNTKRLVVELSSGPLFLQGYHNHLIIVPLLVFVNVCRKKKRNLFTYRSKQYVAKLCHGCLSCR